MKSDNEEERIKNRIFDKFAKARIEAKKRIHSYIKHDEKSSYEYNLLVKDEFESKKLKNVSQLRNIRERLNSLQINFNINKELKEENEDFLNGFNSIKHHHNKYYKSNENINDYRKFDDMILKYKEKGYKKVPKLNIIKHNIFKQEPLLSKSINVKKIIDIIRLNPNSKKNLIYLTNTKNYVNNIIERNKKNKYLDADYEKYFSSSMKNIKENINLFHRKLHNKQLTERMNSMSRITAVTLSQYSNEKYDKKSNKKIKYKIQKNSIENIKINNNIKKKIGNEMKLIKNKLRKKDDKKFKTSIIKDLENTFFPFDIDEIKKNNHSKENNKNQIKTDEIETKNNNNKNNQTKNQTNKNKNNEKNLTNNDGKNNNKNNDKNNQTNTNKNNNNKNNNKNNQTNNQTNINNKNNQTKNINKTNNDKNNENNKNNNFNNENNYRHYYNESDKELLKEIKSLNKNIEELEIEQVNEKNKRTFKQIFSKLIPIEISRRQSDTLFRKKKTKNLPQLNPITKFSIKKLPLHSLTKKNNNNYFSPIKVEKKFNTKNNYTNIHILSPLRKTFTKNIPIENYNEYDLKLKFENFKNEEEFFNFTYSLVNYGQYKKLLFMIKLFFKYFKKFSDDKIDKILNFENSDPSIILKNIRKLNNKISESDISEKIKSIYISNNTYENIIDELTILSKNEKCLLKMDKYFAKTLAQLYD